MLAQARMTKSSSHERRASRAKYFLSLITEGEGGACPELAEGVREFTLHISPFHFDFKNKLRFYSPLLKIWREWKFRAG